jgi:hypothetical protein
VPGVPVVVGTPPMVLLPGVPVVDGTPPTVVFVPSPVVDGSAPVVGMVVDGKPVDGTLGTDVAPAALVPPMLVPVAPGVPALIPVVPGVTLLMPVVPGVPALMPVVPGVPALMPVVPGIAPGVPRVLVPNDGAPIEPTDGVGASVDGVEVTPGVAVTELPAVEVELPASCATWTLLVGRTRSPIGIPALAEPPAASPSSDTAPNAQK